MQDAFFEWDDDKADGNKEHGVTFEEARKAFDDLHSIDLYDKDHSTMNEARFVRIGLTEKGVLFVIYVMTEEGRVRIIHARKASKALVNMYEEERGQDE